MELKLVLLLRTDSIVQRLLKGLGDLRRFGPLYGTELRPFLIWVGTPRFVGGDVVQHLRHRTL